MLPRYSALALGAIVALVVSGAYQAWRQVGSLDALKDTDYGRLLIVKLVVFAALIVAAAFSREVVNRRFRDLPPRRRRTGGPEGARPVRRGASGGEAAGAVPSTGTPARFDDDGYDDAWDDDDTTDEEEVRRLRRSVRRRGRDRRGHPRDHRAAGERGTGPRRSTTEPVALTMKSEQVWVYVDIAPGAAGPNDMHFTALPTGGGPATVTDMTVQLTRPGEDLPPFTVPLQKLGAGHYYSPLYDIPFSGEWQMTSACSSARPTKPCSRARSRVR